MDNRKYLRKLELYPFPLSKVIELGRLEVSPPSHDGARVPTAVMSRCDLSLFSIQHFSEQIFMWNLPVKTASRYIIVEGSYCISKLGSEGFLVRLNGQKFQEL